MKNIFKSALSDVKKIHSSIEDRSDMREIRVEALKKMSESIVKVAFDTRRVNPDTDYNPRRNLQHYHRSEPFISKDASENVKTLFKLKGVVDSIKDDFVGDPDWLDSYCRILSATLDRTLRIEQNDMDFFKPQMDYLNELLYLRYRLRNEDIQSLNEKQLRSSILDRDEKLLHKHIYEKYSTNNYKITKDSDKSSDLLINKLFGEVKANKDNKEVQRSVTITINDKILDELKKDG